MSRAYACPGCGGEVPLPDARIQTVYCPYCAQPAVAIPSGFDPRGGRARLADTPTIVRVGDAARVAGHGWQVVGRVQYRFESGLFDHFFLTRPEATAWLEQDEGELRLFTELLPAPDAPGFEDLGVGERVRLNHGSFYTLEFGEGAVVGGAGALPMLLLPGAAFSYVDGTLDGWAASLKYSPEGAWLLVGQTLSADQLQVTRAAVPG